MSNTLTMYLDPFEMEGQQRADCAEALTFLYAGRDPAEIPNVKEAFTDKVRRIIQGSEASKSKPWTSLRTLIKYIEFVIEKTKSGCQLFSPYFFCLAQISAPRSFLEVMMDIRASRLESLESVGQGVRLCEHVLDTAVDGYPFLPNRPGHTQR
jgi:hypothetical protein